MEAEQSNDKTYEIYIIENINNGKKYVGQTCVGHLKRWYWHCNLAKNNGTTVMSCAIRKYGPEGFTISLAHAGLSKKQADDKERQLISILRTQDREYGYNCTEGGEGGRQSDDVRKLMSDKKKGRIVSWMIGPDRDKIFTKIYEARIKDLPVDQMKQMYLDGMSTIEIGKVFNCGSSTVRNRLVESGVAMRDAEQRGVLAARKHNFGKHLPDNTGSKRSEETKRKMRDSNAVTRRDIADSTVVDLYVQGYSTIQIGSKVGMSAQAIRRRLKLNGVKMRPVGVYGRLRLA